MSTWLLALICFFIIVLAISLSGAIIYQARLGQCGTAKNPWCYTDWKCLNQESGTPYVVNSVQTQISRCSPMTGEAGLTRVAALNAAGCVNVAPDPKQYPNCRFDPEDKEADGTARRCKAAPGTNCPQYAEGDIDWTTRTGCVPAKGYENL